MSCLLFKTVQFIRGKVKAIPGYAVEAYWGEEVQLHTLTLALDEGSSELEGVAAVLLREKPPVSIK